MSVSAVVPVVLAGGVGSRLWPLSRELYPKQYLKLVDVELTMMQATCKRGLALDGCGAPIVVCNEEHRFLVASQLQEIGVNQSSLILEPEGKNTAPAIALAAIEAMERDVEAVLLVLPADHVIRDMTAFVEAVKAAEIEARDGKLVTFGVVPAYPETGYGYIKAADTNGVSEISAFVEKPDAKTAAEYLEDGSYFWNSGMFMFKAKEYLAELEKSNPAIFLAAQKAMAGAKKDMDFIRPDPTCFAQSPSDSIDYAVMEHTEQGMVVPYEGDWSDVGSWSAVYDISSKDESNNVLNGDVLVCGSSNNYVYSEHGLVSLVGVEDLVVVHTADATLVARKEQSQEVKKIVEHLKSQSTRTEHQSHVRVHRPWGTYESVDEGKRHQVKRIVVNPGASLSLQMHHHRAEHWIVVEGTAVVQVDDSERLVAENESIYIPIGSKHRLSNPGKIPLHIIEVQSGAYLGEDDIVRFEDNYGRSE